MEPPGGRNSGAGSPFWLLPPTPTHSRSRLLLQPALAAHGSPSGSRWPGEPWPSAAALPPPPGAQPTPVPSAPSPCTPAPTLQFVRVPSGVAPSVLFDLLLAEWHLPAPNLVVSLVGEERPFALKPWLRDVLRKGLVKAAQSTGGSGRRQVRGHEGQGAGGSGGRRVRAQAAQGADRSGGRRLRLRAGQGADRSGAGGSGRRQVRGQAAQGAGGSGRRQVGSGWLMAQTGQGAGGSGCR